MKRFLRALLVLVFLMTFFESPVSTNADETEDKLKSLDQKIEEYQKEVERLNQTANTLNNQISQYDAQINLTETKISRTEEKIRLLGGRIDQLEGSLDSLTQAFSERASRTYKLARVNDPYLMIVTSDNLNEAVNSYHYLSRIISQDQDLLERLQDAKDTYQEEKVGQEDLQNELEGQQAVLGSQKQAKAQLLTVTKNDEKKYQQLIAQARAEREAIQSIIAGKGSETEVGSINEGDRVASVIPSPSVCSSGAHLHFEVVVSQSHRNPADYLSPKEPTWDNGPDTSFGFSGSWRWPLSDPIRITQGFGSTYYASVLKYYGGSIHTGIDMINTTDYTVKAVKPGTLYRGAISCGGGTLRYVRVKQADGIDTYYLHINY